MRRLATLLSVIALLGGCALAGRSPAPSITLQASLPAPSSSTTAPSPSPMPTVTPVPVPSAPTGLEGTIAYVSGVEDPQIFLLDLASGESRQLTHLTPDDAELTGLGTGIGPAITCGFGPYSLSWRPDGSMLALTYGSCETVVYTVELDGTLHRIGEGRSPRWSPDGTRLVFGTNVPYAPCGVDCLDPSLGPWEILMADPMGITAPVPLTANGGTFTASMPTYSPDGTRIAFSGPSSTVDPTGGWSSATFVMDADGTDQRLVSDAGYPTGWLPSGELLVMTFVGESELRAIDIDTGASRRIAEADYGAAVSPDGSSVLVGAYAAEPETQTVEVRRLPGGDVTATVDGSEAAWSVDGRHFATLIGSDVRSIAFHAADGTTLGAYGPYPFVGSLAWQPQPAR